MSDDWSNLLTTDMDKLFVGRVPKKVEKIQLKKGERRNVTVLFLDIKGFTAMSEKLDPEEVTQIIDNVFKVLTSEILRYGGMIDKYIGDCIMALYGAKTASEDDAERAIRSALGMLDRMKQVNVILEEKGIDLNCRIGINTGLVVAGELGSNESKDFTVMGDTVNTASRLESNAEVGTIMISDSTRSQAGEIFRYEELEPVKVKGKEKPLKVFRVHGVQKERVERWERDSMARSREYIGRESEWKEFEKYANESLEKSTGEGVSVIGLRADGGMGKSRMVHEFLRRGACPRGIILKGRTISYTMAPYRVFISVLKNLMGVQEGDPTDTVREHWQELLESILELKLAPDDRRESLKSTLMELEDYLAYLLGVSRDEDAIKSQDPNKLKEKFFAGFKAFFEVASCREGEGEVMYMVLDDLHWVDELSKELIDYLIESLQTVRKTVIVGMYRPDYVVSERWEEGENYREIEVKPLSLTESSSMIERMFPGLQLSGNLAKTIYDKTSGNPFYTEEICLSLIDQGVIISDDEIQEGVKLWTLSANAENVELPDTIHGMVQTRIDKLTEEVRDILLKASVIGQSFTLELLENLHVKAGGEVKDVKTSLETCARTGMVAALPVEPEEYVFSNALIQEVCYNTLLNYNKEILNGLVGDCLEDIYGGGPDTIPQDEHYRLADHFEKGKKADKAYPYLQSSADTFALQFSNAAAIDFYTRLLNALDEMKVEQSEKDAIRLKNLFSIATVKLLVANLDEAYNHFADCCKLGHTAGNFDMLCQSMTRAGEIDRLRSRYDNAEKFFSKSLELAKKLGNDFYQADNLVNIGILLEEQGDYAGAMDNFQKALALATTDEQRQNISHYIFQQS